MVTASTQVLCIIEVVHGEVLYSKAKTAWPGVKSVPFTC